jgi:dihydroorotase
MPRKLGLVFYRKRLFMKSVAERALFVFLMSFFMKASLTADCVRRPQNLRESKHPDSVHLLTFCQAVIPAST